MWFSPYVRMSRSSTSQMIFGAMSQAVRLIQSDAPKLMYPCASGGDVFTITASRSRISLMYDWRKLPMGW